MLQNWFQISSPSFHNKDKHPTITLPDEEKIKIIYDNMDFRINQAWEKANGADKGPNDLYFWFRMSGLHVYYTSTHSDINVLGVISILKISELFVHDEDHFMEPLDQAEAECPKFKTGALYCFTIDDQEHNKWKLCTENKDVAKKWACKIKEYLMMDDPKCRPDYVGKNITVVEKTNTQPIIILPLPSRECNENWDYNQLGANWECDCAEGQQQSPIDLPEKEIADSPVKPLFQYDEISATSKDDPTNKQSTLKLELKENMLRIKHPKFGKLVTMDGTVYYAQEIQIHTPAEHTFDGKTFDMEVQIIHYGQSKGDLSKQAILCFLFKHEPGKYNKFIDDLDFYNLPNRENPSIDILNKIYIPNILYDAEDDQVGGMRPFSFYTYQGSLTSPPCSEDTIVYVASEPLTVGSTALKLINEAIKIPDYINKAGDIIRSSSLPVNNRKTQPRNERPVFLYDHIKHCGPDPIRKRQPKEGHYEKVQKPVTDYFYVNGKEPSGLPGAFVVNEGEAKGKRRELPDATVFPGKAPVNNPRDFSY